ncbi:hypothetical protein [Bradyrhizobium sp. Tv2a-2]|uniref:hypothetical protein n=1 Tax=Bradyrhizobium sp. Tv2a-2 TaxID=113395 RepID=UPI00040B9AA5|nr:hypothetical protein [Bradyrhizobium sp. Tv2a-2]
MDRVIVYPGALPQDTDLLNTNLFALINGGFKNSAIFGTSNAVSGLACTPTAPASLQVNVGVGSIFEMDEIDASAYGSLGSNTQNIMKQGILPTAQTLTLTPPGTTGFSQVYLVQAALEDIDAGAMVLSYYNSANPLKPFSGPNNSGSSNYTIRTCRCVIQLKAGVPATTGTQVAPSADAGWVGLYTITIANATTQITSGMIAQLASAPFFRTLPQVPYDVQQGYYVYGGTDTGTANNYVVTFQAGQPIPAGYTTGMEVEFKALNTSTGSSQVNVQGLGNVTIRRANGVATAANDITSGQIVRLKYDGTFFQIQNYTGSGANTNTSTVVDIPYVADSGTQNAIVATFSPSIGSLTDGIYVSVKLANAITGAATLNANGLGAKPVVLGDGTNPPYNVFVANMDVLFVYSTAMASWQIANTSAGMFYRRPTSNYNIYVNTSTGSDTLYDGTSATVGTGTSGPVKTISKAILIAFGYAPSQFSITIQVANGTYSENVQTPGYAGPNVIIQGASTAGVIINGGNNTAVDVGGPNTLTVNNVTVQTSGANANGFSATNGATLTTNNTASNGVGGAVFAGYQGATINPGNHTFNGSCATCFAGYFGGFCNIAQFTYTFSTPISVIDGTVLAYGGQVEVSNGTPPSFVNASYVNGQKFQSQLNGLITCYTLGLNFLPGTQPGILTFGGQYLP